MTHNYSLNYDVMRAKSIYENGATTRDTRNDRCEMPLEGELTRRTQQIEHAIGETIEMNHGVFAKSVLLHEVQRAECGYIRSQHRQNFRIDNVNFLKAKVKR
jgi:hypothetical protein